MSEGGPRGPSLCPARACPSPRGGHSLPEPALQGPGGQLGPAQGRRWGRQGDHSPRASAEDTGCVPAPGGRSPLVPAVCTSHCGHPNWRPGGPRLQQGVQRWGVIAGGITEANAPPPCCPSANRRQGPAPHTLLRGLRGPSRVQRGAHGEAATCSLRERPRAGSWVGGGSLGPPSPVAEAAEVSPGRAGRAGGRVRRGRGHAGQGGPRPVGPRVVCHLSSVPPSPSTTLASPPSILSLETSLSALSIPETISS